MQKKTHKSWILNTNANRWPDYLRLVRGVKPSFTHLDFRPDFVHSHFTVLAEGAAFTNTMSSWIFCINLDVQLSQSPPGSTVWEKWRHEMLEDLFYKTVSKNRQIFKKRGKFQLFQNINAAVQSNASALYISTHKNSHFPPWFSVSCIPVFRMNGACYCTGPDFIPCRKSVPFERCRTWEIWLDFCLRNSILKVRKVWSKNGVRKVWLHPSYIWMQGNHTWLVYRRTAGNVPCFNRSLYWVARHWCCTRTAASAHTSLSSWVRSKVWSGSSRIRQDRTISFVPLQWKTKATL